MVSKVVMIKQDRAVLFVCIICVVLTLSAPAAWCLQGLGAGGYINGTSPLRRAGIPVRDQEALIKTLNRRDKPALAASAAFALGTLPKNDSIIQELNFAAQSDSEMLMATAIASLKQFGDRQWVPAARARLANMKDPYWRLGIARILAEVGVFDGWEIIESTIMTGKPMLRATALFSVDYCRNMKDASGQPVDLIKKLDEMRARSTSKPVRDALLSKINQLTYQPPAPAPPRRKQ